MDEIYYAKKYYEAYPVACSRQDEVLRKKRIRTAGLGLLAFLVGIAAMGRRQWSRSLAICGIVMGCEQLKAELQWVSEVCSLAGVQQS